MSDTIPSDIDPELVKIWQKIIDVQQHFNDVKSKNQTLFISILTASIAATGYLFQNKASTYVAPIIFQASSIAFTLEFYTLPLLGGVLFTLAFYILDHGIYQTLLKGAVECGKNFESEYLKIPLTSTIVEEHSKEAYLIEYQFFGKAFTLLGQKGLLKGAGTKLQWFYRLIFWSLLFMFLLLNIKILH